MFEKSASIAAPRLVSLHLFTIPCRLLQSKSFNKQTSDKFQV